jgi:hypothetical protein
MRKLSTAIAAVLLLVLQASAQTENGMITKASAHPADATTQRLENAIKSRGFVVFARLDHAAGAKNAGLSMPYSTVVVFGNPKGKYPPAEPGALGIGPLKAAIVVARPRRTIGLITC